MRRQLRRSSLGLFFGFIFLLSLVGQAVAGWKQFNADQVASSLAQIPLPDYLASASFAADVAENWQSEFLQFLLYIVATVWLLQIGSPESKELDKPGLEGDKEQKIGHHADESSPAWARVGGWRTGVYSWSLSLLMGAIFFASWFAQSFAGRAAFNEAQLKDLQDPISWTAYLANPDFWSRTLQNWQSEFLAVGSMAVFSIYLRQRGSPESKPVGAAHSSTGIEG
jgi:hypothetical protein